MIFHTDDMNDLFAFL